MKNKKWLLIIVGFIFLVNLAYFMLTRSGKVDLWVQDKVIKQLELQLDAEVSFDYFTFNDRQLNVSGINIEDRKGNYELNLKQVFVEFNLLELIFSNFKNLRSINTVKLYEPELTYNYKYIEIAKSKENSQNIDLLDFELPELRKLFKQVEVYDGVVNLQVEIGTLYYSNSWNDIDLTISNDKKLNADVVAQSDNASLHAVAVAEDQVLEMFKLELINVQSGNLQVEELDSLAFSLDGSFIIENKKIDYTFGISNLKLEKEGYELEADLLNIAGNVDTMMVDFTGLRIDENEVFSQLDLIMPFQKHAILKGKLISTEIPLDNYLKDVKGMVDLELDLTGSFKDPLINAEVDLPLLEVAGQKLSKIEAIGKYRSSELDFEILKANYLGNLITATGSWNNKDGLQAEARSGAFLYEKEEFEATGDILANLSWQKRLDTSLTISNLDLNYKEYEIPHLTLNATTSQNEVNLLVTNKAKSLNIEGKGDLWEQSFTTEIDFKRFNPNYIVKSRILPLTSGYLNLSLNSDEFKAISSVRLYDQNYGKLDGRFNTNFIVDFADSTSFLSVRSKNAKFNYEDVDLEVLARGNLDSLHTQKFILNKELYLESWIELEPKFSFGLTGQGSNIKLKDYAAYFSDSYTSANLEGSADFNLNYCSTDCSKVGGFLNVNDFKYEGLMPLDLNLKLSGKNRKVLIDEMNVFSSDELITNVVGDFSFYPQLDVNLEGDILTFPLENFLAKSSGDLWGNFKLNSLGKSYDFGMNLRGSDFDIYGVDVDELDLKFNQNDSMLSIHEFQIEKKDLFNLEAEGELQVNAFTSEYLIESNESSDDTLSVSFRGDIFKLLEENVSEFESGGSNCQLDLTIGVHDGGLFARKGSIILQDGFAKLASQPSLLEDIKLNFQIKNNELNIEKFTLKAGEGKLYITNEIGYNELDLHLANLNLGALLLRTNSDGILFHMPGYMPQNSQVKVVLQGHDAKYATLTGPFDEMRVTADLQLSNGEAIYPPNTENLFKLINNLNKQSKISKEVILPLELDLRLFFGDNIRYVTYPTDLKVASGSYLYLQYIKEEFLVSDALFSCYEGSVDILGTTLEAEQLQVNINQSIEGVKIVGEFQKTAADGTVISLIVRRDEDQGKLEEYLDNAKGDTGSSYGDTGSYTQKLIDLEFRSDNSSDSMMDILSLLRYGRRSDELTASQNSSLMQDELIQLAGVGIESAFLDPLISPLENWVRKALHLDYFRLQTDIIQNIFSNYSSLNRSQDARLLEDEENNDLSKFDTDMFLNNLSVNMGRYITRTVFLDYEARVSKEDEYISKSKIGVYHYFTVRYNLPWKLKLSYEYNIQPFKQENTHQLQLQRTFHFY